MADAPNVPTSKPGEDGRGVIRWSAVYEAMTGATAPGNHHESKPGVYKDSLTAGHEPDKFEVKGIVMVPVLVVVVTGLTYLLVTGLFAWLNPGAPAPGRHPAAVANNERPFNQRLADIDSSNPNAKVPQPRLEYIRQIEQRTMRNGEPEPIFVRSYRGKDSPENSPEIYPQDLYPDRYTDHRTGKKVLAEYDWVSKEKGVARIPVSEAMKQVAGKLPARKDAAKLTAGTTGAPKISNGGQTPPAVAPGEQKPVTTGEAKKPEAPKAEEKKDAPQPPAAPEKKQ